MTLRQSSARMRPTVRLFLDSLDHRDVPSFGMSPVLLDRMPPAQAGDPAVSPVITEFSAVPNAEGVTLSGKVSDPQTVAGATVSFTGSNGQTATAMVNADGTFSVTVAWFGNEAIFVDAVAIDADGNRSDTKTTSFTPVQGPLTPGGPPPLPPLPPG